MTIVRGLLGRAGGGWVDTDRTPDRRPESHSAGVLFGEGNLHMPQVRRAVGGTRTDQSLAAPPQPCPLSARKSFTPR
jgi:hypothetical protein